MPKINLRKQKNMGVCERKLTREKNIYKGNE